MALRASAHRGAGGDPTPARAGTRPGRETVSQLTWARVHPIELLRHVARASPGWADESELAADAAIGLAALSHDDPAALVTACARMLERHPDCEPLRRACERMLAASDPDKEADQILQELHRTGQVAG